MSTLAVMSPTGWMDVSNVSHSCDEQYGNTAAVDSSPLGSVFAKRVSEGHGKRVGVIGLGVHWGNRSYVGVGIGGICGIVEYITK